MPISVSSRRLNETLVEFAWNEWAQLGLSAHVRSASPWAQDIEALLLFTLHLARRDPRLFDEVLGWLVRNESLLSARRLRSLAQDDEDRRLLEAAFGWVHQHRPQSRLKPRVAAAHREAEALFQGGGSWAADPDPAFALHGFLRPPVSLSTRAGVPHLQSPIALGLRLRELLGVGARAEVMRYLLTTTVRGATSQLISESTGYSKRNTHEALLSLHAAGVVSQVSVGNEQRFGVDRRRWEALLTIAPESWPTHEDWPQLLRACTTLARSLDALESRDLSSYQTASGVRDMLERVREDLTFAGVRMSPARDAPSAMDELTSVIQQLTGHLTGRPATSEATRLDVFRDTAGVFRWAVRGSDGGYLATSGELYATPAQARQAAHRAARTLKPDDVTAGKRLDGSIRWAIVAPEGPLLSSVATHASTAEAEAAGRAIIAGLPNALEASAVGEDGLFSADIVRQTVAPNSAHGWEVLGRNASASGIYETKTEAVAAARETLVHAGGGELTVRDTAGRILDQLTISGLQTSGDDDGGLQ